MFKKLISFLILTLLSYGSTRSQSLDIDVQGEIYEYATYYVSSFDIGTGATNVQILSLIHI